MSDYNTFASANNAYENGDYKLAFKLFLDASKSGDTDATSRIASMYADGEGVDRDYEKSIEWDLKAIGEGNVVSMANLAITYRMIGNIKESKYWFEQAIGAGDSDAALELAKLFMVSDKEKEKVVYLLNLVLDSKSSCDSSKEEASTLLDNL